MTIGRKPLKSKEPKNQTDTVEDEVDEFDMSDQVESEEIHNRKVQDIQKIAEKKVRVLEKNPGVGEKKKIVKRSTVNVDKDSRKSEEISTDKKKETKDNQPKIFTFCRVGGGGGVFGPSGNLPIKQGIKGGAPKVTKKQPFCSVGSGGGLLGPYLISPTTSTKQGVKAPKVTRKQPTVKKKNFID